MRTALLFLLLVGACQQAPPPQLVGAFGGMSAVPAEEWVGGKGPHFVGEARLTNGTPDTLALALSGPIEGYHTDPLLPPDPDGPGWFALVLGRDTVRLASDTGGVPSGFTPTVSPLVLRPGDTATVRVRTPAFDVPPGSSPPPYAYADDAVRALMRRHPRPALVYIPNARGLAARQREAPWLDSLLRFAPAPTQ